MKATDNESKFLTTTNTIDETSQTPIEIALQIDEDGMTTLSALYTFLQLDQSHYKRWYNKNFINNEFAIEMLIMRLFAQIAKTPKKVDLH